MEKKNTVDREDLINLVRDLSTTLSYVLKCSSIVDDDNVAKAVFKLDDGIKSDPIDLEIIHSLIVAIEEDALR